MSTEVSVPSPPPPTGPSHPLTDLKCQLLSHTQLVRHSGQLLHQRWTELDSLLDIYESKLISIESELSRERSDSLEKTDLLDDMSKDCDRLKHELDAKDILLKRTQEELFREKKKVFQSQNRQNLLEGEIRALREQLCQLKNADRAGTQADLETIDFPGQIRQVQLEAIPVNDDLSVQDCEETMVPQRETGDTNSVLVKSEPSMDQAPHNVTGHHNTEFDELVISALYSQPIGSASQINITPRRPSRRMSTLPLTPSASVTSPSNDVDSVLPSRSVSCHVCGAEFAKQSHLAKHMFVHEQRHKCPECGRLVRDVQKHMTSVHSTAKQHNCSFCGKGYADAHSLRTHVRNHTGEKPYACAFCQKRFTAKIYLRVHERTHSGEQRYCCSLCGQRFVQRTQLTKHSAKYHGLGHLAMSETIT